MNFVVNMTQYTASQLVFYMTKGRFHVVMGGV